MIPVRLKKGKEALIEKGFPWIFENDLVDSSEWRMTPAGGLVSVETQKGVRIGVGYINPQSQIACRILTRQKETIDEAFFARRLEAAFAKREKLIGIPYYRLVHSEADFLPGLTIDRFGDLLSIQVATAGMELLQPLWLSALQGLLDPKTIVLRNDIPSRGLEGLAQEVAILPPPLRGRAGVGGTTPEQIAMERTPHPTLPLRGGGLLVEVREYDTVFLADILRGQKTGWFYDQRDNRKMLADVSKGKAFLDVYSHSGGFGIPAAKNGANVTLVDSSKLALELAQKAAALNDVQCETVCGDAFEVMKNLADSKKTYGVVSADPPPFIKSKKDFVSGMKGYAKVARHAAALVENGGLLFVASCSHHASRGALAKAVMEGIKSAGRSAEILRQTGASADHPVHPLLPQSEYLHGILLKVD